MARTAIMTLAAAAALALTATAGAQVYVDKSATGDNNGTSWANAYTTDLGAAATDAAAAAVKEVWIAANPAPYLITDFTGWLQPGDGVAIYGGFAGGETDKEQRNGSQNVTVIDAGGDRPCVDCGAVSDVVIDSLTLTGAVYNGVGGGVRITTNCDNVTVSNCVIAGNTAGEGGGVYIGEAADISITSCSIYGNLANGGSTWADGGGGIKSDRGQVEVVDSVIVDNTATRGGGGVLHSLDNRNVADPYFDIIDCVVSRNTALADNGNAGAGGGGFYVYRARFELTNTVFDGNSAIRKGGGLLIREDDCNAVVTSCTIRNHALTLNDSENEGGAGVYIYGPKTGDVLEFVDCAIEDNTCNSNGGGVMCYTFAADGPTVRFSDCRISGNTSTSSAGDLRGGGGVSCYSRGIGVIEFTTCTIEGNRADSNGAGVFIEGGGDVSFVNSILRDNRSSVGIDADHGGGAIFGRVGSDPSYATNLTLTSCTLIANRSDARGGGVMVVDCVTTLTDTLLLDNRAERFGGAVGVYQGEIQIDRCVLARNTDGDAAANKGGGGLYVDLGGARVNDSIISANRAMTSDGSGGGVALYQPTEAVFKNTQIVGNRADASDGSVSIGGGGVKVYDGDAEFHNCLLASNTTPRNGGGILVMQGGDVLLSQCVISDNTARNRAGAVFQYAGADMVLANCIVTGNSTNNSGSAAIDEADTATDIALVNCLFDDNNRGDFKDENATVYSGADVNNAPDGLASGCFAAAPGFTPRLSGSWTYDDSGYDAEAGTSTFDVGGSFTPGELVGKLAIANDLTQWAGYIVGNTETAYTVYGNLTGFGAPGTNRDWAIFDYRLADGSAAIDAGADAIPDFPGGGSPSVSAPLPFDIDNNLRPVLADLLPAASAYDLGAYEVQVRNPPTGSNVQHWTRY